MGKKRHLRKEMQKRELEEEIALVICVGKKCCSRDESRAVVEAAREYAEAVRSSARIVTVGCLDICKDGPIAARYPAMKFEKRVTAKRARRLLDKLGGQ
jgi:(2Fe-2S) ferredoxin